MSDTNFKNPTIDRLSTNLAVIAFAFVLSAGIWWITNAGQGWHIN